MPVIRPKRPAAPSGSLSEPVEMKSPLMGTFAQALASLNIGSIALETGLPKELAPDRALLDLLDTVPPTTG